MTKINIQQTEEHLKLTEAILLYRNDGKTLATMHKVNGQLRLSAGKPLDMKMMTELFLRNDYRSKLTFLPGNVLAVSLTEVIWYQKGELLPIYFNTVGNRELNAVSGWKVCWPNLIFKASGGGLQVWAVKCRKRPALNTPLYRPPLTNINDHYVCMRSPEQKYDNILECAAELYRIFVGSAFTLHHNSNSLVKYAGGHNAFWADYCHRSRECQKPPPFPADVLNPIGKTLKDIL